MSNCDCCADLGCRFCKSESKPPVDSLVSQPLSGVKETEPVRVYLSGPMKGYPDSNFPAFHAAAELLRERGLDVVNPAEIEIDVPHPGAEDSPDWKAFYDACLRADLRAMMDCHAIALMRGWEKSSGANLELHVAHRIGMDVLFVDDLLAG